MRTLRRHILVLEMLLTECHLIGSVLETRVLISVEILLWPNRLPLRANLLNFIFIVITHAFWQMSRSFFLFVHVYVRVVHV